MYLGGNEQATHKYVSELLGKATIDTNTYNQSYGLRGNYTRNYQLQGRELLTPDEVRMLDNRFALLFIRGERPVKDLKYDIMKHPNVGRTADGKAESYIHGGTEKAIGTIMFAEPEVLLQEGNMSGKAGISNESVSNYELLSEEDVEKQYS